MNIIERIKKLGLPPGQYVVVGSGTLDALGIRPANDIDLAVTPELFETLRASRRFREEERYGKIFLEQDGIDIIPQLAWADYPTTTEEAIASALIIEGIPFMNLDELKRFKLALGREKDGPDIALIEEYRRKNMREPGTPRRRATIFILDRGRILLIHRRKNGREYYVIPGGGIEPGETEIQAAVREAKEETGLAIVPGEKIGEITTAEGHEYLYLAASWTSAPALGGPEAERRSPANDYLLEWLPIERLNGIDINKDARGVFLGHLSPAARYLGATVSLAIDRPVGSKHPKWDFEYPVNYGYVPGTKSGDGEELDAYVLGVDRPLKEFSGPCIAIIHRLNDDDDKLVLAPDGKNFTDDEIRAATDFQEHFFKSVIVR